jgi:hypothetical protein
MGLYGGQLGYRRYASGAREFVLCDLVRGHAFTDDELLSIAAEPLFVEWLRFEYQVPALGATLLPSYARYADELPFATRRRLEQLLDTQRYSFWRIGEVVPGNLEMIDVRSGARTRVREYSLAKQVHTDDCFFLRVAQQDDHWEIIGAETFSISFPNLADAQAMVEQLEDPVSIKSSFGYIQLMRSAAGTSGQASPTRGVSLAEARQALDDVLESTGLGVYISRFRVEELMKAEADGAELPAGGAPQAIRLLIGLADGEGDLENILQAGGDLWNALLTKKPESSSRSSAFQMQRFEIEPWQGSLGDAHLAMRTNDPAGAYEAWQEVFRIMHESTGTSRSLHRLYANAGTAYLMNGDLLMGERLLDIALELCPGYDFAQQQKDRIASGEFFSYAMQRVRDRVQEVGLEIPPSSVELRSWSNTRLADRMLELGLEATKDNFAELVARARALDDFLENVWGIDRDDRKIDEAHCLAVEANRRWAPKTPWPETLEHTAADFYQALFPEFSGERRSVQRAKKLALGLSEMIQRASNDCIQSWMEGLYGYDGIRAEITEAGIELGKSCDDMEEPLEQLFSRLYERTSDPVFLVPGALAFVRQDKPIMALVGRIARELPEDETALMTLAEHLPEPDHRDKEAVLMARGG